MGLLDLFKQNPTSDFDEESDTGFSLPKLFNDDTRARLGVLGSNLIAAGFGNSPDANAVLNLGKLGDERKQMKKLKKMADRMADKQDAAGHHDIADALRTDPTFLTTMIGKNIDQENTKAMKLYERGLDPRNKFFDDVYRSMGTDAPEDSAAEPSSDVPMIEPGAALEVPAASQNALYQPAQAAAPQPKYNKAQRGLIRLGKMFHPDYTDEEALRWAPSARSADGGAAAANQIQSDREYNMTARSTLKAAELRRTQEVEDKNKQIAADLFKQEEAARITAETAAKPRADFEASLKPVIPPNSGQSSPVTAPPRELATPEQVRQNQIIQKAGLPQTMNTQANAQILEAAAAAGPKEYAAALEKMTAGPKLEGGIAKTGAEIDQYYDSATGTWKQVGGEKVPVGSPIYAADGVTITGYTGGPAKKGPGEQQVQGMALQGSIQSAIPAAEKFYDTLADEAAMALFGGAGNFFMSDEAQQAQTGILAISSASVYAKSGAASTDTERANAADMVTPKPWDKEGRIKLKKNMLIDQVALIEIRARAGLGDGTEKNAPPMTAALMRKASELAEARKKEAALLDEVKPGAPEKLRAVDVPTMPQSFLDAGGTANDWNYGDKETWDAFK